MTRDSQYPKGVTQMLEFLLGILASIVTWN